MAKLLRDQWVLKTVSMKEAKDVEGGLPDGIIGLHEGIASVCDVENENERTYERALWQGCFESADMKARLELRNVVGQLGHPPEQANPRDATHITVAQVLQEDGKVAIKNEIFDTPDGRILKTFLAARAGIGLSTRGFGDEIEKDGKTVVDPKSYKLEAYDFVWNPSFIATIGTQKLVASKVMEILQSAVEKGEKFDESTARQLLTAIGTPKAKRLAEAIENKGKIEETKPVTDDERKVYQEKIAALAKKVEALSGKGKLTVPAEEQETDDPIKALEQARDMARQRADAMEEKYRLLCASTADLRDRYKEALRMLKESTSSEEAPEDIVIDEADSDASRDYRQTRKEVDRTLKDLDRELSKHTAEQSKEPDNRGYHGDMTYVLDLISQAVNFLRGSTPRMEGHTRTDEQPKTKVKNPGILQVPKGKNVEAMPLSHFVKLAKSKGLKPISSALMNLVRWFKKNDPKLSKWAGGMQSRLSKAMKEEAAEPAGERTDEAHAKEIAQLKQLAEQEHAQHDQQHAADIKAKSKELTDAQLKLSIANKSLQLAPLMDKEKTLLDSAQSDEDVERLATEITALRDQAREANAHSGEALLELDPKDARGRQTPEESATGELGRAVAKHVM